MILTLSAKLTNHHNVTDATLLKNDLRYVCVCLLTNPKDLACDMNKGKFEIESSDQHADVTQFLEDKLYAFNSSAIGKFEGDAFAKIIRDQHNNIIAGISGWAWAKVSEIMLLWVGEQHRKNGLGEALLKAAEEEILKRGCTTVLLRSYSFQAPAFYEKHGYEIVYVMDDFPTDHKCYFLVKRFKNFTDAGIK